MWLKVCVHFVYVTSHKYTCHNLCFWVLHLSHYINTDYKCLTVFSYAYSLCMKFLTSMQIDECELQTGVKMIVVFTHCVFFVIMRTIHVPGCVFLWSTFLNYVAIYLLHLHIAFCLSFVSILFCLFPMTTKSTRRL